ncbi:MAG TPA: universal stress protein [Puia sp.]|nr:universal stress protein [Puia sp.]
MKKIIAVFDGLRFSNATLEQAVDLAKHHQAHLVGVFLSESLRTGFAVYETVAGQTRRGRNALQLLEEDDRTSLEASIDLFESACRNAGLEHSLHKDKGSALEQLVHESIFADLLVIDRRETFSSAEESTPGWFVKYALHEVLCPVWIAAPQPVRIDKLIFLYDGKPSSVYAMKQFAYLFPDYSVFRTEVFTFKPETLNLHVPDHRLIHEWTKRHYPNAVFQTIQGDRDEALAVLRQQVPALLVTGSYRRPQLSMFFERSFADELMRNLKMPVFIAHA